MKKQFTHKGTEYQAYWNEKEYGKDQTRYMTINKVHGTSQYKGSFSVARQEFVDYRAGDLDLVKSAAEALGF